MKTTFLAACTAFFLLSVAGCNHEVIDSSFLQSDKMVRLTIQTRVLQTRADYLDNGTNMAFSWRSGDEISAFVDGVMGDENCRLTTNASGKSVPFSGTVTSFNGTKNIYAFYPFSQNGYTVAGGDNSSTATSSFLLPNPQTYTVGDVVNSGFMVGVGTSTSTATAINASLNLKQVMCFILLNITNAPGPVTGVKLKCTEPLFPTTATVGLSDAAITNPASFVSELSMNVTDGTSGANKVIPFAMFPADLTAKNISVEVTFAGGEVKSIDKIGLSFVRNTFYVITFDATGAVMARNISPMYIVVGGLKWAIGNLVANGPKGCNSCRIGTPEDGGLYFQFGSIVGWSGGATGDGIGRPGGGGSAEPVAPSRSLWVKPFPRYNPGGTSWDYQWSGNSLRIDTIAGTGDPCRYYLGGTWRLPTKDEYVALFANSGWPSSGPWQAVGSFTAGSTDSYAVHSSGLKFPAVGERHYYHGGLVGVGLHAYYRTQTRAGTNISNNLQFTDTNLFPDIIDDWSHGGSVRCVQN